ncbi:FAD/NAD(P)-binding domain-containing protein [Pluteus cervinus]|uniref:FAD/NAD(P)-binding domain-containing protein n=1 Tax=Pluteus cervinus TaxID=181527 RepID=A0ACD3AF46_9AGAR|nr:FAD/NAD(P)-binding domain-containing protein [Pluteus cervinus]
MSESQPLLPKSEPRVVVIGAGVGGLAFAINIKKQLNFHNITIYEKASDVGGTWRDNIYPGCSSDIPIHFYSLSTDLNPEWSKSHCYSDEIQLYLSGLAEKYKIYPQVVFNRKVVLVEWKEGERTWSVTTEDVKTGVQETTTANVVVSALGILEVPKMPDIPGLSSFEGKVFHSARWDTSVELQGKRVAVIGNGASATQFVPRIAQDPNTRITHFSRTPNWFLPPIRTEYSGFSRWAFRRVPLYMQFFRLIGYLRTELFYVIVFSNSVLRRLFMKTARAYIRQTAPARYHDWLVPNYTLGCKRVIFDTDYLATLHQSNVELNHDGIASITQNGIITRGGETLPFDVIILATGFIADDYPLEVRGRQMQTIAGYYDSKRGPQAYLGTTIPNFPNFFFISGPNTATGHTSVIFTEEVQIDYILKLISPLLDGKVSSLEVKPAATDAYNEKIQARLSRSVFLQCISWYRRGGEGKVTSIFPGPGYLFWWWLRTPNWSHYSFVPEEPWKQHLQRRRILGYCRNTLLTTVALASLWWLVGGDVQKWIGSHIYLGRAVTSTWSSLFV